MKKDESLLPRTNLPAYVTDQTMADLDALAIEFTKGNRAELVRQCLDIGIEKFKNELRSKLILDSVQDANEVGPIW